MLERLELEGLALIERAELDLGAGLLAITGETGAGKSLLVFALSLLAGARGNKDYIRQGAERARIEASFTGCRQLIPAELQAELYKEDLVEEAEFPDELIISRELSVRGRNICRLNGRLMPLSLLRRLGPLLLDIQSQRDQALIYDEQQHLKFLEQFGGPELEAEAERYRQLWEGLRRLVQERRRLGGDPRAREHERALLAYQVEELGGIQAEADEEERLLASVAAMEEEQAEALALDEVLAQLEGGTEQPGVLELLSAARSRLAQTGLEQLEASVQTLALLLEQCQGLQADLERRRFGLHYDEAAWNRAWQRLDQLRSVGHKYGKNIQDLPDFLEQSRRELRQLENAEERLRELDQEIRAQQQAIVDQAARLSAARREAAGRLETAVVTSLAELGMPGLRFAVQFRPLAKLQQRGAEDLAFYIQANPGEALGPISQIASGGESSRILLAVKCILSCQQDQGTMVFDEVDAGISGEACQLVAAKLQELGRTKQVLCITHAAQIAACGREHWKISKSVQGGRTRTQICRLEKEGRVAELARLLAGDESDAEARRLARQLLKRPGR